MKNVPDAMYQETNVTDNKTIDPNFAVTFHRNEGSLQ